MSQETLTRAGLTTQNGFESARLDEELTQMRERRASLEVDLAEALDAMASDNSALAKSGGKKFLDAATVSTSRVAAIKGALATLATAIAQTERTLASERAREEHEAVIAGLVRLAEAGNAAAARFIVARAALNEALLERVPELVEAQLDWVRARREWVTAVREVAPWLMRSAPMGYAVSDEEKEGHAEVFRLVDELRERVDLSAVRARQDSITTVVDQTYALPEVAPFAGAVDWILYSEMARVTREEIAAQR
jgi:hypothetical protein